MSHVFFFKDLFESIPEYRKTVFLMFLFKNYVEILHEYECGFVKNDNKFSCLDSIKTLLEQNEECLDSMKNE